MFIELDYDLQKTMYKENKTKKNKKKKKRIVKQGYGLYSPWYCKDNKDHKWIKYTEKTVRDKVLRKAND